MTDIDLLIRVGEALYGPRWQSDLARALGPHRPQDLWPGDQPAPISDRTMRRWAAGHKPVPAWVWPALVRLLGEREGDLRLVADLLRNRVEAEESSQ